MIKYVIALLISLSHILFADETNVIDSISKNKRLTKLNEYIVSSELSKNFLQFESLTVFAPLDDAFCCFECKNLLWLFKRRK